MLVLHVLLGFGAYGAILALFASVAAVAWFVLWRSARWLARLIGRTGAE